MERGSRRRIQAERKAIGVHAAKAGIEGIVRAIREAGKGDILLSGRWGIEREALRVDGRGLPFATPHPFEPDRGDITVDFAENQIEFVTSPRASPEEALSGLAALHGEYYGRRPDEYLWPLSAPGRWDRPDLVKPASFAGDPRFEKERAYRRRLVERYGTARQVFSGVHVNISFGDELVGFLHESMGDERETRAFRDDLYMRLVRNFAANRPLAVFLFSASPVTDAAFAAELSDGDPLAAGRFAFCGGSVAGMRQGPSGYALSGTTEDRIGMEYSSLSEYVSKLRKASEPGPDGESLISGAREFYAPARPKPARGSGLDALEREGIGYVELRSFDLDPFAPAGIGIDDLRTATVMALAAALLPGRTDGWRKKSRELSALSSLCTLGPGGRRAREAVAAYSRAFLDAMEGIATLLPRAYGEAVRKSRLFLEGGAERPVERFARLSKAEGGPLRYGLLLAENHKRELAGNAAFREREAYGIHDIRL